MTLETWLLFIVVSLPFAASPGPAMLFAISTALSHGARATLCTGLANALGLTVIGLLVGLGMAAALAGSAWALTAMKIIGGGYLIYLGLKLWRDPRAFLAAPESAATPGRAPLGRLAGQALLIALTNPKSPVIYAALFPAFLSLEEAVFAQVLILSASFAALCAGFHALIAVTGASLRRYLSAPHRARLLRRSLGAGFIGFGAALAVSARA
ncbi:MAG: LysE family translocator [Pseudomonadota bacterium]